MIQKTIVVLGEIFLSPHNGLVVDPFSGSGTMGFAVLKLNRQCVLIDNNLKYFQIVLKRLVKEGKKVDTTL